jgi:hypothetical protein
MRQIKVKTLSIVIASILILSMLSIFVPAAQAEDFPTYGFLSVSPNPVGLGQRAQVTAWVDLLPNNAYPGSATATWTNYNITVISPSGKITTDVGPSDPVGSKYISITPDEVGSYTIKFSYAGETVGSRTIKGTTAPDVVLVVQDEPIGDYPNTPLPTEYWTRPINAQNRDWYAIQNNWYGLPMVVGSSWAGESNWVPVGSATNSAHVLWKKEKDLGGLISGELGNLGYYSSASYESKWSPPVILNGKLYYQQRLGASATLGLVCRDLATGEQLWFQNGTTISFGQSFEFDSPNQHGAFSYLWSSGATYRMFDPFTGTEILRIVNATTGRHALDEKGNLLSYILNGGQNTLTLWNATKAIVNQTGGNQGWDWRANAGINVTWSRGIEWNVSVPDVPGSQSIATMGKNTIIAANSVGTGVDRVISVTGYSTKSGAQLFNFNVSSTESATYFFTGEVDGKFAWFKQETMTWYGYDATTGKQLWQTEPYESAWGMYTSGGNGLGASSPVIAYGKLYAVAYDGTIHCFDMETGNNDWNYYIGNAGYETPYGTYPLGNGLHVAADGKIFAAVGEHSPNHPLYRGAALVAVNATNGEEIWRSQGWLQGPVIADGTVTAYNHYDNSIYNFGKGPTALTVSAPDIEVPSDKSVLIKGNVIDISPGTKAQEQASRFPNGVPAVSDQSQTDWMAYVYQQQPKPTNTTGVSVTINVIDSNGNQRPIGQTTTNANGFFSLNWKPDISGTYTVTANFAGSESYWPSHADTAFTVSEPTATQAPVATASPSAADLYFIPAIAGIIVAIALVGIVMVLLLLKKRP